MLGISEPSRCPTGDWVPYSDYKCFKLIKSYTDGNGVESVCRAEGNGTSQAVFPATIRTQEEQDFITNFVFNESSVEINFWFGLKMNEDGDFVWVGDGSKALYTNWEENSPTGNPGRTCVELSSRLSRIEDGQWKDVTCQRPNYVLCEAIRQQLISRPGPLMSCWQQLPVFNRTLAVCNRMLTEFNRIRVC